MAVVEQTSHDDVLCYLSSLSKTALRSASIDSIAESLDRTTESVRYALEDLTADGAVARTGGIFAVLTPCRCAAQARVRLLATSQKHKAGGTPTRGGSLRRLAPRVDSSQPEVVKSLSGFDLATRFRLAIEKAAAAENVLLGPDPANHGALAGAFARWRRDGIPSETVAAMIDLFAADIRRHKRAGRPMWRLFLAARSSLYTKVTARVEHETLTVDDWTGESSVEQHTYDRNYWTGEQA